MQMRVTKVIEKDTDRVLLEGTDTAGARKTFHLKKDSAGQVDKLVELVESGQHVEVEI